MQFSDSNIFSRPKTVDELASQEEVVAVLKKCTTGKDVRMKYESVLNQIYSKDCCHF